MSTNFRLEKKNPFPQGIVYLALNLAKIIVANIGKKRSKEAKQRMSIAAKKRASTPEGKFHLSWAASWRKR